MSIILLEKITLAFVGFGRRGFIVCGCFCCCWVFCFFVGLFSFGVWRVYLVVT